jgi:cytochrome c peroxidase
MKQLAGVLRLSAAIIGLTVLTPFVYAQIVDPLPTVEPLGDKKPPGPPEAQLAEIVKDQNSLVVLGKALFWDSSVGSDGQACASCHFNAGADPRIVNQLSPGLRAVPPDFAFGGIQPANNLTASGQVAKPNIKLKPEDFPLHKLQDPGNRQSPLVYRTNDVVSSQGVFQGGFVSLNPNVTQLGSAHDFCSAASDGIFDVVIGGVKRQVRKVEPRNTPTMINAAFFDRNFWDGRANNVFNGVSPFGERDPDAFVFKVTTGPGLDKIRLSLKNMSAASQAVGPTLSDFEMACSGRGWNDVGRKLLPRTALAGQKIATTDSVLGPHVAPGANRGLTKTYQALVRAAFKDAYWNATGTFDANGVADAAGYTLEEKNFSMFWGLAIDAYERTLISNQTRFDQNKLSEAERRGLDVFLSQGPDAANPTASAGGKCVNCHTGPLFSGAAVPPRQPEERVERMIMGDNGVAFYDGGFYNIGVAPTQNDLGVGATDPWGNPLSFARQHITDREVDDFGVSFAVSCSGDCGTRVAVDGAFKTPSLRNVALTAPYFHNGGAKSLEEVVEFYDRGGNRCGQNVNDTTGSGPNGQGTIFNDLCQGNQSLPAGRGSNLDPDIQDLGLSTQQKTDLVAFLKALTDNRVRCHAGPFDHPELFITNGHKLTGATNRAADAKLRLREVGKAGYASTACAPNTGNLFTYNVIGPGKMLEIVP